MSPRPLYFILLAAVLSLGPAVAGADQVKVGGFWIPGQVSLQTIAEGQLIYLNSAGLETRQPLEKVEGLRVEGYPEFGRGFEALEQGNPAAAEEAFTQAAQRVRQPWLKHFALHQRLRVQDQQGKPAEAAQAYLTLVEEKADGYFLAHPPLRSLLEAPAVEKATLAERLRRTRSRMMEGPAAAGLDQMLQALEMAPPTSPAPAPGSPTPGSSAPGTPGTPDAPPAPDAAEAAIARITGREALVTTSVIPLPSVLDRDDPVTQLLMKGQFAQAREEASRRLQGPEPRMQMRLYQLGLAQLNLAESEGSLDLYKDAGLSFMRVLIYYPDQQFTGPALLEAGYVHEKIGRPDLAQRLYRLAANTLEDGDEPEMMARLNRLRGTEEVPAPLEPEKE